MNNDELKIQVFSRGVFLFVSLLVLMRMMMTVMMSLSLACLGGEGTRYLWFQHCVFHSETEGAPGSLTQLHISPMPPLTPSTSLPLPPHPAPPQCVCHILTPVLTLPSRSPLFPSDAKCRVCISTPLLPSIPFVPLPCF